MPDAPAETAAACDVTPPEWVRALLADPELCRMGHGQRAADGNLGLGWLYYALVRMHRPRRVVCIGSWRGFVPIVLARALKENGDGARLTFIDPSLVDDFWKDPQRTRAWFESFGLDNVEHHCTTTQAFVASEAWHALDGVGLLFVDGYHTEEQARFDHEAFASRLAPDAFVFFHDSIRPKLARLYGPDRHYTHTVHRYIDELKRRPDLQVMDFPMDSGVTLVRRAGDTGTRTTRPAVTSPAT